MLKDKGGGLALRIAHHIKELDDVCSAAHILQDLNFSLNLLFLHGF